jgi:transcriptional regulator with XRE-family HTH domain
VYTKEYRSLCTELRTVRESAGLSQRALAAKLEVPHSWVAKVEAGERRIDLVELTWFLLACGVDAEAATRALVARFVRTRNQGGRVS